MPRCIGHTRGPVVESSLFRIAAGPAQWGVAGIWMLLVCCSPVEPGQSVSPVLCLRATLATYPACKALRMKCAVQRSHKLVAQRQVAFGAYECVLGIVCYRCSGCWRCCILLLWHVWFSLQWTWVHKWVKKEREMPTIERKKKGGKIGGSLNIRKREKKEKRKNWVFLNVHLIWWAGQTALLCAKRNAK